METLLKGEDAKVKIHWKSKDKTTEGFIRMDHDAEGEADTFPVFEYLRRT